MRIALTVLVLAVTISFAAPPVVKLAPDGFPTGQQAPEGVATDLARAFIHRDVQLFRSICVRPYSDGESRSRYINFLDGTAGSLRQEAVTGKVSPDNPIGVTKVFAARHLSRSGPASYGYASFGFQDVMFVDVEVLLNDGGRYTKRTLVIKDRDGKWYVHPAPDISPLLADGLDGESASVRVFSNASTKK
jgi:hypothetical protein